MIRPGETLLLEANVGGVPWAVIESDPTIEPGLTGLQGMNDPTRHACYLNSVEVPPEGRQYVAAHELVHAIIFVTGGKEGLKVASGLKGDKLEALEEYIVCALFHSVWDTFTRNGWLKIP